MSDSTGHRVLGVDYDPKHRALVIITTYGAFNFSSMDCVREDDMRHMADCLQDALGAVRRALPARDVYSGAGLQ